MLIGQREREGERESERERERGGEQREGGGEQLASREVRVRPQARGGSNMDFPFFPPLPCDFTWLEEVILAHVDLRVTVRPKDRKRSNREWLLQTCSCDFRPG